MSPHVWKVSLTLIGRRGKGRNFRVTKLFDTHMHMKNLHKHENLTQYDFNATCFKVGWQM